MEQELLHKFFNRNASQEEKERIRVWLDSDPKNTQKLLEEREFFDALILSDHLKLKSNHQKYAFLHRNLFHEILKVAAVFLITLTCGFYFYHVKVQQMGQVMNTISVPAGQRVNLTLSDGTNIWLNARTQLQYPAVFIGNTREITLHGEAYLEVTRNEEKPFIVHTKQCKVEVLGTKFNIEAYNDSEVCSTSLMEGSIKVSDNQNLSKSVLLSPNQKTSFANGDFSTTTISDFDAFRWKEGLICFRNVGFHELMSRFEKYNGIQIVIKNKNLDKYRCSGKFRISDGVDNALRLLQKDARFSFERNQEESVIYVQ